MPWYRQMYNMNISRPVTITTHVSLYRGLWIKAHRYFRGHQIWSLLERKDVEQDHWKCLWMHIQLLNFVMMMVISSIKATRNEKSGFINCKFWFQKLGRIFIRVHSQTEKFCLKFFRNSNFSCRSKRIVFISRISNKTHWHFLLKHILLDQTWHKGLWLKFNW